MFLVHLHLVMWASSLRVVTNLFLQPLCPLCNRPASQDFCHDCWRQLQTCAEHRPAFPTSNALLVLSWGLYQRHLKQAITALKYDGNRQLARPLGIALGQLWQQFPIPAQRPPLAVPIPLHSDKLRKRGFNQAALLAEAFCQQTGLPLVTQGLLRQRATAPQFGLTANDRQKNLTGAFAIGPAFENRYPQAPVLLIDDIYTTGTTVRTAAAVLRRHRISVCGVATIARATLDCKRT